jgi:outer membrane immunogenic protein
MRQPPARGLAITAKLAYEFCVYFGDLRFFKGTFTMSVSKLLFGFALGSFSIAANAADLPRRATAATPAPMAAAGTWTGFYVGATTGYNFFTNLSVKGYNPVAGVDGNSRLSSMKPNGALLGVRAGYDHQIAPSFVIGVLLDGDIDFGKKSRNEANGSNTFTGSVRHSWTGALDVKAGYAVNDMTMLYALGGFARGQVKVTMDATQSSIKYTKSEAFNANGWNAGLGVEHRFTKQVSAFAEYRFNEFRKEEMTVNMGQAKLGVGYRF